MTLEIADVIADWPEEDLKNLIHILDPESEETQESWANDYEGIEDLFRWAYYSKVRAGTKKTIRTCSNWFRKEAEEIDLEQECPVPSYNKLLTEACKKSKAYVEDADINDLEIYLLETMMISVLKKMKPDERHRVLCETFDPAKVAETAKIQDKGLLGPMTALGAVAAANASGFGIYLAATTTLGFLTHAVGISLPFAAYTGLSSTIAVLIGPAGWLGAGIYGAWFLTKPKWKKIIPALIYIIGVRHRSDS